MSKGDQHPIRFNLVFRSPVIRTFVSLCLISAVVAQPLALIAAQTSCRAGQQTGITDRSCSGCDQGEAFDSGQRSACCCAGREEAVSPSKPACCQPKKAPNPPASNVDPAEDDPQVGKDSSLASEPERSASTVEGETSEPWVRHTCACSLRSEPASPSIPRSVNNERAESAAPLAWVDLESNRDRDRISLAGRLTTGPVGPPSHYSQRHLCIWRL